MDIINDIADLVLALIYLILAFIIIIMTRSTEFKTRLNQIFFLFSILLISSGVSRIFESFQNLQIENIISKCFSIIVVSFLFFTIIKWVIDIKNIKDPIQLRFAFDQLLQQKYILDKIIDNPYVAVISILEDGKIIRWNSAAEKIFGWKKEEVIGKPLIETIIPNDQIQSHLNGFNYYLRTGKSKIIGKRFETGAKTKESIIIPVELFINIIKVGKHEKFIAFIKDLTEKMQEEEIRTRLIDIIQTEIEELKIMVLGSEQKRGILPELNEIIKNLEEIPNVKSEKPPDASQ